MLVQYCVRPEVEIILFAIIAVKHLISHRTFFHTNIPALGFKRWGSIKITLAAVRKTKKQWSRMMIFVQTVIASIWSDNNKLDWSIHCDSQNYLDPE